MHVGMGQLGDLPAGRAHPARIAVVTVRAVDVLHVGHGQRQPAEPFVARKKLGMADAAAIDAPDQMADRLSLSYDLFELHSLWNLNAVPPNGSATGRGSNPRPSGQR